MEQKKGGAALRHLRMLFHVGTVQGLTDGQLLERFATNQGAAAELAFAALVERHGAMVMRVCRGVLADPHDTQDAFQATFLVLVKKARGLWVRDSLGPWLHQVAYRTAQCARINAARRRKHEYAAALFVKESPAADRDENAEVIHEEIERLPERYRAPIILCDLSGQTHEQAARGLGWPVGTVKTRLTRGREKLRERLAGRGLGPNACVILADPAKSLISPAFVDSTARAAVSLYASRVLINAAVTTLVGEVLKAMSWTHWLKIGTAALTLGATVTGSQLLAQREGKGGSGKAVEVQGSALQDGGMAGMMAMMVPSVSEVKQGKLTYTISERGSLEAARSSNLYSRVEGQATIISLLPEGTKVKTGDLVCELDSAALKDKLVNQVIVVKAAEAAYQNAKLTREVAEIAVAEYNDGIFKGDYEAATAAVANAESVLKETENRLTRTRLALERIEETAKGSTVPANIVIMLDLKDRIEAAVLKLAENKFKFEQAQTKKRVLEIYTKKKVVKELLSEVEKARTDEIAKQQVLTHEKAQETKFQMQIAYCRIVAPSDGVVVYANDPNRFAGAPRVQIEEGAAVRERQMIISIPDINGPFVVNTKVRESIVDRIAPGQRARIKIDAFPEHDLTGRVIDVSPLPDPSAWLANAVKVYTTHVEIDKNALSGARPGMTAQVEILVSELDNVMSVPISAILRYDNKYHVAVKKADGKFDWREVTLGLGTESAVEVKAGLKPGESVALEPASLLSDAERRERKIGEPTKPAEAKEQAAAKAKGKAGPLSPQLLRKLRSISEADRPALKTASPSEREAILKKAGFTDDEIRQFEERRTRVLQP